MNFDFPELRTYLSQQENFDSAMHKTAWMCTIKDNISLSAIQMLDLGGKIYPSSIVVKMPDGSYKEFWADVNEDEKNIPYDIRLASYSEYFFVY
jgi:hypothetical protein